MSRVSSAPHTPSISLQTDGDQATLVARRFLRHPPGIVWRAITEPEQIQQWYLTTAIVDGHAGGAVDLVTGPSRVHATGRILTWDPPRVFEHEWNLTKEDRTLRSDERSVVRWELRPQEGGTLLVLTHRGLTRRTAEVFQHGLPGFLDRLEALLEGRPLPDWAESIRESRRREPADG
jgi:uncharacterized protein YndB with AHSA1/START domain